MLSSLYGTPEQERNAKAQGQSAEPKRRAKAQSERESIDAEPLTLLGSAVALELLIWVP